MPLEFGSIQRWLQKCAKEYCYGLIAAELHSICAYYDQLNYVKGAGATHRCLLDALKRMHPSLTEVESEESLPDVANEADTRTGIVLNGAFNHSTDIQGLLGQLFLKLSRTSRVLVVAYNPYYRWLFALANRLGLREAAVPSTFVTRGILRHIARLASFETVRIRPTIYLPYRLGGLGTFLNRWLAVVPGLRWLAMADVIVLRPVKPDPVPRSVSVLVAARNERGNIGCLFERLPVLCPDMELVIVEGHSKDGTWEEIQKQIDKNTRPFAVQSARQSGIGKADAIRLAAGLACKDIMVILDADLTVAPELLPRFYRAYREGAGDFINGSRLVYPLEERSMRFANWLGNIFFAKALNAVLGAGITDSLCGTKLFTRADYQRMCEWRSEFGDFDPFGDFELLFPASQMALGIADVPVKYGARTYGSTNISRFRHGVMLMRMVLIGLSRIASARTA